MKANLDNMMDVLNEGCGLTVRDVEKAIAKRKKELASK
jgi:hypothetical protein